MPAPAQELTAFQDQVSVDARAIMAAEARVLATYKPMGSDSAYAGAGSTVSCVITLAEAEADAPGRMVAGRGRGAEGPINRRAGAYLEVAAAREGELQTGGVSATGGIVRVKAGDTFEVPGYSVARPDQTSVVLRAGAGVDLIENAFWCVEVHGA